MKYKIKIEQLDYVEGKSYPNSETVYEQVAEMPDILDVIKAVNGLI